MAGQYGASQVTIRRLTVVRVDTEQNLLLIKGALPGKPGALLNITPANIVGRT
jgi:large subunit ribosomal protein L3